jgi:hypothetical protein
LPNGDIDWVRVNNPDEMAYFHGTTGGDVNGDGLIDVGGAPQWDFDSNSGVMLFLQNQDGSFEKSDSLINFPDDYSNPFTVEFADVMGDEKAEIITADYGEPNNESKQNHVMVFAFDDETRKYELHFVSQQPRALYDFDMGATSIQTFDFTGDGIRDFAIAREDMTPNGPIHSFEIWKGLPNAEYEAHWVSPVFNMSELMFREFWVFDVNQDGAKDIVLRPSHGDYYSYWNENYERGIQLNKVIWINDGDGRFSYYDESDLVIENIMNDAQHPVFPYLDNGVLHFMGTHMSQDDILLGEKAINLTTYDIEVKLK